MKDIDTHVRGITLPDRIIDRRPFWSAEGYALLPDDQLWWCNTHQRRATARRQAGFWEGGVCCAPGLAGILLPCQCVNLTGMAEIISEE